MLTPSSKAAASPDPTGFVPPLGGSFCFRWAMSDVTNPQAHLEDLLRNGETLLAAQDPDDARASNLAIRGRNTRFRRRSPTSKPD